MKKLLALLVLWPAAAWANTVKFPAPAWWSAPFDGSISVGGNVQLVYSSTAADGTVTYTAIAGQTVNLPALFTAAFVPITSFDLVFPGQTSAPMNVAGVKVNISCSNPQLTACTQSFILKNTSPTPVVIPAGAKAFVHYTAPALGSSSVTISDTDPSVQPAPPPPPSGLSPDGTTVLAPNGSVTTSQGTWTWGSATAVGGWALLLNGTQTGGGFAAQMSIANGGQLYVKNVPGNWYVWTGSAWSFTGIAQPF